ncbi:MAG: DUF4838 domain-containing protein, partial [Planctomycetota bacterium]
MAKLKVLITLLVLVACTSAAKAEVTLVKDGKALMPIIIYKGAPNYTRKSADELASYIELISGAKPKVIEGEPKPVPASAVWIGVQPVMKKVFPKLNFDFKNPEEILIAANDKHLVIAGRDIWNPNALIVADPGSWLYRTKKQKIIGKQLEYGTANAVYTFLQDYLDVRFLWPGETDIIKKKTISFSYFPQVRARSGMLHYSWLGGRGNAREWCRLQRLQLDSLYLPGGHAFSTWWDKYSKIHPDIFALQPDGTRSGFPDARTVKLCQSNPKVWELWLKQVEEKLKNDPNKTVFNASPNDGYTSGICVCESCRKWDNPKGTIMNYHWQGMGQEYVAMSDRYIFFANKLAELLKKKYPGKDYYVLQFAYGNARPAPAVARPADNVIVP